MTTTPLSAPTGLRRWHLIAAGLGLLAAAYLSLGIGVTFLTPRQLLMPTDAEWVLISQSRLPRLAAVLLAGSALAVAGLIMQRITQNAFVSPSTSGTIEAATLGIVVATVWFAGSSLLVKMLLAIGAAIAAAALFLQVIARMRTQTGLIVALVGLMYGGVIGAVTTFIAYRYELLQVLETWTTGSFSSAIQGQVEPLYLVLGVTIAGYALANRFTIAGMGESFATGLGLNYRRTLYLGVVVVCVMTAVIVVVVGAIPFLGLIVPNIVSMILGDNVRTALPVTALGGAAFVLACDVAGRLIRHPYEIPASTIAGIAGALIFLGLILRAARTGGAS